MDNKTLNPKNLRFDLPAGIVVFFVALPLCLGIALASGAPLLSGLIAGIIGGLVVGFISDSHVSVSGPAAGLATIVLAGIATLGSFEAFLLAVVLAGVIQVALGFAKIGSLAEYFPSGVIHGMLTAIGIIIIIKQFPVVLGIDPDAAKSDSWLPALDAVNPATIIITAASLLVLIIWDSSFLKRYVGVVPAGLMAVLAGSFLGFWLSGMQGFDLQPFHMVSVPVASSLDEFKAYFQTPDFSQLTNTDIYVIAFTIAVVGSLETLLNIEAADQIDPQRRVTSTNRELQAQGAGNIISGLIGGLPITSVVVRTSANVQAKARTKMSAIFHGALLLGSILMIPALLNIIPLSCLAAILLMVGYKLAHPKVFYKTYKRGRSQFFPFIVTVGAIVVTGDLLEGVLAGLLVSLFIVLRYNLKNSCYMTEEEVHEGDRIRIHLSEEVSFLNKAAIRRLLDKVPEHSSVTIDAKSTFYIDTDVMEVIEEFANIKAPQREIDCALIGFKDQYTRLESHVEVKH